MDWVFREREWVKAKVIITEKRVFRSNWFCWSRQKLPMVLCLVRVRGFGRNWIEKENQINQPTGFVQN